MRAVPAYAVDVVDTTGAGDAYHGAFLYALLQDWAPPRMAQFASAVGSMNCRAIGGRSALPTRREVDAFMAANPNFERAVPASMEHFVVQSCENTDNLWYSAATKLEFVLCNREKVLYYRASIDVKEQLK